MAGSTDIPTEPTATARSERRARGKAARSKTSRSSHAAWMPAGDRPDPVEVLTAQAATRLPQLLPIRYGRMLVSPFTFYRGAAAVMAADLAATPSSGLRAQICGDAHLSNFGGFASPERDLVFDINDFDETLPGPWEWDLKRLAASLAIAGRDRGFDPKQRRDVALAATRQYREAIREFAEAGNLEVWYARLDTDEIQRRWTMTARAKQGSQFKRGVEKARTKDRLRAFAKLTHEVDGEPRIVSDPPLIIPIEEWMPDGSPEAEALMHGLLDAYRASLQGGVRALLDQYRVVDMAMKVVGVGSVGTRSLIVLLLGADDRDPLFLQVKEAQESVLEPFAGRSAFKRHGRRVIEGQRLMQASSDILLGWVTAKGIDGVARDYYVRQLWDWKRSAEVERMGPKELRTYGEICAWTLARAHVQSCDRIALAAYLGRGDTFDRAIADFAEAYADQNERDYEALRRAADRGLIEVETGI